MKRPDGRTMFLAHPLVAYPAAISGLGILYAAWCGGGDGAGAGLFAVAMLAGVGQATARANAYKQWKREWDAMSGEAPPSSAKYDRSVRALFGAILAFGGLYLTASSNAPGNLPLVGALVAISIAVLAWWRKRRHGAARLKGIVPVQVVAAMCGPVPTLDAAYAGLPDHLKHLVKATRR